MIMFLIEEYVLNEFSVLSSLLIIMQLLGEREPGRGC